MTKFYTIAFIATIMSFSTSAQFNKGSFLIGGEFFHSSRDRNGGTSGFKTIGNLYEISAGTAVKSNLL